MSTAGDNNFSQCAACGEGGDKLKTCKSCKLVKYCNATCQRAHWCEHKKECKKRAAEMHDEALFKQPPPIEEECPICCLPHPWDARLTQYYSCCGKSICSGCTHADAKQNNRSICPFCRTPGTDSHSEQVKRLEKRMTVNDADAFCQRGFDYYNGKRGTTKDCGNAFELWLRAGELGCARAYDNIADAYCTGGGVKRDVKKAIHYYELAAMGGHVKARHNLGCLEGAALNWSRAIKHWMIAAEAGFDNSLKAIRIYFMNGRVAKDDFERAIRAHKRAKDEMTSDQRKAAAAEDQNPFFR